MKDYKKILEDVINIINTTEGSDIGFANICTYIGENCPELKESEDEKIRKEILDYIDKSTGCKRWISWLEQQGEQTSWKPSKEEMDVLYGLAYITDQYDEHKEIVITRLYQDLKREFFKGSSYENMFPNTEDGVRRRSTIQILEYARSLDTYNQYGKADIDKNIAWLENQENKDSQVILSNISWHAGSEEPEEQCEILCEWESKDAVWHDVAFYHADTKTFWNGGEKIEAVVRWIYVNDLLEKQGEQKYVEEYNITGIGSKNAQGKLGEMIKNLKPANEVEPKFEIGDRVRNKKTGKETVVSEIYEYVYNGTIPFYIKDQDDWELVEQNPARSEEDEINYNYALAACKYYGEAKGYTDTETHQKTNNWLKSLKEKFVDFDKGFNVGFSAAKHNQWKPSEEQMQLLKEACDQHWEPDGLDPLYTLYQDLKKL